MYQASVEELWMRLSGIVEAGGVFKAPSGLHARPFHSLFAHPLTLLLIGSCYIKYFLISFEQ